MDFALPSTAIASLPVTLAQTAGGESGEAPGALPTIQDLFLASVYINSAILALSLAALTIFAFLLFGLNSGSFAPTRFVDEITRLILNRRFEQAITHCQNNGRLFISGIVQRMVENRDKEHGVLTNILDAEGRRQADVIWNRVNYLAEIAAVAPTLGLLGTVIGMIDVFFTLTARVANEQDVARLSGGIAEAMSTTMFGLIVAILAGIFYTVAKSRATRVLAETEQVAHTIADHTHRAGLRELEEQNERPIQRAAR